MATTGLETLLYRLLLRRGRCGAAVSTHLRIWKSVAKLMLANAQVLSVLLSGNCCWYATCAFERKKLRRNGRAKKAQMQLKRR
jgi:hypothetical protein